MFFHPACGKIVVMALTSAKIKELAYEQGFVLAGIASAAAVEDLAADRLVEYINGEQNAGMGYLARNLEKRLDVTRLVDGARSVICCAVSYNNVNEDVNDELLYIARYARFGDYHNSIKRRLRKMVELIEQYCDSRPYTRVFVDTAPLLEKYYAVKAGLGWQGKNTLLLNKDYGSRLLLGEIVIDIELEYDEPVETGCGDCELCIRECPGGALLDGGKLDCKKCISYHTIESKELIPDDIAEQIGNRIFGCDSCQDICPYNINAKLNTDPEFMDRFVGISKGELATMSEKEFVNRFGDTPILRAGLARLKMIAGI